MKKILIGVVALVVLVALIDGLNGGKKKSPSVKGAANASGGSASPQGGSSRHVTRTQYGAAWPLTVSSGILGCQQPPYPGAVTFTAPDGTVYWVNGTAGDSADKNGWQDIHPIWAKPKHPLFSGQRKDIGVLIDAGLKLCQS